MPTKTTSPVTKKTAPKKVAAKKAVVKKAPAKKSVATRPTKTSSTAPKTSMKSAGLVCASEEQCFWTTDGSVLESLEELVFAFGSMEDTVFVYHADGQKNDFAEWVEHVLKDAECAKDLRKAATPKKAHSIAKKHLKKYT